jgi:hypothetical protein
MSKENFTNDASLCLENWSMLSVAEDESCALTDGRLDSNVKDIVVLFLFFYIDQNHFMFPNLTRDIFKSINFT